MPDVSILHYNVDVAYSMLKIRKERHFTFANCLNTSNDENDDLLFRTRLVSNWYTIVAPGHKHIKNSPLIKSVVVVVWSLVCEIHTKKSS